MLGMSTAHTCAQRLASACARYVRYLGPVHGYPVHCTDAGGALRRACWIWACCWTDLKVWAGPLLNRTTGKQTPSYAHHLFYTLKIMAGFF